MSTMRHSRLFAVGIATAVVLIALARLSAPSSAQTAAKPTAFQSKAPGLKCDTNPKTIATDPFKGSLVGRGVPPGIIPVNDKDSILNSGLPCQESVSTGGQETIALDNLQRGFDFYSWRTFIALNSPADGKSIEQSQADTPTRWEDMDSFKQLLDVMLPADMGPPKWPADRAEMEAEKVRLLPPACRAQYKPGTMVVKMIEESYNEPFKTGPLIDQQGHYAIFDILMNRQMFDYIRDHHLYSKEGQQDPTNFGLAVDFPVGQNPKEGKPAQDGKPEQKAVVADTGAFMLKVSWKILGPDDIKARNFHMVNALVSMPKSEDPNAPPPPCLRETLGLIGFHAVHKTASRPQWIWTSFEHKNNVPDRTEVTNRDFHGPYNFFDVNCGDKCAEENATPPRQFWQPDPALQLKFKDATFKSQIVREVPLTDAAKNMNSIFHSMLKGTVWDNYMLISTQWPSVFGCTALHSQAAAVPSPDTDFLKQPDMNCSPAPTYLANSTLETYSQGKIPLASSSCIGCHGNAVSFQPGASNPQPGEVRLNQSDFTFMLEKAPGKPEKKAETK
ncbi:hypothetical protein [Bradyrhizobium erythrophlei]|nr:hypothetical protein [Bradyrhizobium erythrophlei]